MVGQLKDLLHFLICHITRFYVLGHLSCTGKKKNPLQFLYAILMGSAGHFIMKLFELTIPRYKQVVSANKGGVVVILEGLRGFVPFSQISTVSSASWSL